MSEHVEAKPVEKPIRIKKYANRRLYNTASSSYVTLDHLAKMVREGLDFVVEDAKSGEDITRTVLTQIIFEAEGKGQNLLPISFLRQLIGFYGDSLQALVPSYLELSMASFSKNQEQMRHYVQDAFAGMNPFKQFEEMGRQNMAIYQRAMSMFNPFAGQGGAPGAPGAPPPAEGEPSKDLDSLKDKLEAIQKQLDQMTREK
ncbi:polyhydroxyalkanoate synthesis repressor PhaR [Desertibaculum subflavum]|uniref:polyhydroxyalkanoate synthesis repressor PhaR n=1 Tax=Desertibaculum subflavum TaxID=2268458 RepID=UPI000E6741A5